MFRMIEGRISEVPLNELMKLAVDRVRRRISMLQRFGRLEDVVGPIGGYKMSFAIEMNAFNSLEYLQYGGDGSKFNSFRQVIVPDETLVAESAADAVKPGSAFRQRLEAMPADSAVTIVVYEDSFKEFARTAGSCPRSADPRCRKTPARRHRHHDQRQRQRFTRRNSWWAWIANGELMETFVRQP